MFVFFQAEDGIRDLVRSRGLGDVYKRQAISGVEIDGRPIESAGISPGARQIAQMVADGTTTVSYTHLTLPTSDLV